jgi:hypothetical protein
MRRLDSLPLAMMLCSIHGGGSGVLRRTRTHTSSEVIRSRPAKFRAHAQVALERYRLSCMGH